MNTKTILEVKKKLEEADAIVIGAGAGLSTAAGIKYGKEGFRENFPELYERYGFTDFYTSSFYKFSREEERWSYWAKHINYLCLSVGPSKVYQDLFSLVKDKPYFVITTNADKAFSHNGFRDGSLFEVQGTLDKMQCSRACHDKLYDVTNLVKEMLANSHDCEVPPNLVPYCPICHETMDINLRKDNYFVEDDRWRDKQEKYEAFLNKYKDKKIVFLELGVGFNTPGIIRWPFEELTKELDKVFLIRVNKDYPEVLHDLKDKVVVFKEDIGVFLERIL